jgi:ribosomal-protein-alanine N-acetyltransferase
MTPAPTPRPARPAEAATLAALHATAFAEPWTTDAFAAFLADPAVVALVAEVGAEADAVATEGGGVAGFILCRLILDEAEVLTLAVRPETRRHGLGRRLLTAAAAALTARGGGRLFLEVAEDNSAAQALYAGHGFVALGRRAGYYRRPDGGRCDALCLSARLPLDRDRHRGNTGPQSN